MQAERKAEWIILVGNHVHDTTGVSPVVYLSTIVRTTYHRTRQPTAPSKFDYLHFGGRGRFTTLMGHVSNNGCVPAIYVNKYDEFSVVNTVAF